MTLPFAFWLALRKSFARLRCRLRAAKQVRQGRAAVAAMTTLELRDIGLSHADALPAMRRCSEWH
jgi:uncharacterized protein YjiS (DUF1127 family)